MYNIYDTPSPDRYMEKKKLRKTANFIGLAEVMGFVFSYAVVFIIQIVAMLLGATEEFFYDIPYQMAIQALYSLFLCLPSFIICARLMKFQVADLVPLRKVGMLMSLSLVGITLAASIVGSYATSIFSGFLELFGSESKMPELPQPQGATGFWLNWVVLAAVPALVEEFAFRGVVLGMLRRFGDGFAIIMSAIMFGMFHGNLVQIPYAFVVGIALGYITVAGGSLWPAILAHFANNTISALLPYLYERLPAEVSSFADIVITMLMFLGGVLGFIYLIIKKPQSLRLPKRWKVVDAGTMTGWYFSAPMIIVALVINVLTIISTQLLY